MKKERRVTVAGITVLALSVLLAVGIKVIFPACAVSGDSIMACHWAEQAVFALALVMVAVSLIALIVPRGGIKAGLTLAAAPAAIISAFVPGSFISLCMMPDMQCRSVMQPAVMAIGIVLAAVAVVSSVMEMRKAK